VLTYDESEIASKSPHHSLYSAFHTALYPSGTLGGGGPVGGANSLILVCTANVAVG
jgi:hypothetical protein